MIAGHDKTLISGMTATQLEKLLKATKLCAVHQFAADYNNKAHDAQWVLQEAPNANKVSNGCLRFTLTTNYITGCGFLGDIKMVSELKW